MRRVRRPCGGLRHRLCVRNDWRRRCHRWRGRHHGRRSRGGRVRRCLGRGRRDGAYFRVFGPQHRRLQSRCWFLLAARHDPRACACKNDRHHPCADPDRHPRRSREGGQRLCIERRGARTWRLRRGRRGRGRGGQAAFDDDRCHGRGRRCGLGPSMCFVLRPRGLLVDFPDGAKRRRQAIEFISGSRPDFDPVGPFRRLP
jgi:hypothetical protein